MATDKKSVTNIGFSSIGVTDYNTVLTGKDLAIQDLMNELMTRRGERIMRPDFGSIIPFLIFENGMDDIEERVIYDLRHVVSKDPRFEFVSASVSPDTSSHKYTIDLVVIYKPDVETVNLTISYDL